MRVSLTRIIFLPRVAGISRCVTTVSAPFSKALPIKSCPSLLSPTIGTNNIFAPAFLESVTISEISKSSVPQTSVPPVAAKTSLTFNLCILFSQNFFYNFPFIKMYLFLADYLIGFLPFSKKQYNIVFLGKR